MWGCNPIVERDVQELPVTSNESKITATLDNILIDPPYKPEYDKRIKDTAVFEIVEEFQFITGYDTLRIITEMIPDWEDPGDYLALKILNRNNKVLLFHFNIDGWVKFDDYYEVPLAILEQNQLDSDKLLMIEVNGKSYLFMFGYMYASSPGIVSIIELSDAPTLLFNKEFYIKSIEDVNEDDYLDILGSLNFESVDAVDLNNKRLIRL